MVAELAKVLGTEVGQLMLFPVAPQIFDRVQLRRISGQELDFQSFSLSRNSA
jgi:hypothetical protein